MASQGDTEKKIKWEIEEEDLGNQGEWDQEERMQELQERTNQLRKNATIFDSTKNELKEKLEQQNDNIMSYVLRFIGLKK